jgi:hypothetical protein
LYNANAHNRARIGGNTIFYIFEETGIKNTENGHGRKLLERKEKSTDQDKKNLKKFCQDLIKEGEAKLADLKMEMDAGALDVLNDY